jgi:hypothetical protein
VGLAGQIRDAEKARPGIGGAHRGMQSGQASDAKSGIAGKPAVMLPVVAQDPAARAALLTPDSWSWFTETGRTRAPSWRNEVTLRPVEMFTEYEPGSYVAYVSPTPAADRHGTRRCSRSRRHPGPIAGADHRRRRGALGLSAGSRPAPY